MDTNDKHHHLDGPSSAGLVGVHVDPVKRKRGRPKKQGKPTIDLAVKKSATTASSPGSLNKSLSLHQSGKCLLSSAMETKTTIPGSESCNLVVVEQILIRIPVCSIVKCMCVCKQWYTLIKSYDFIKMHLSHRLNCSPPTFLIGFSWLRRLSMNIFTLYCDNNENLCSFQMMPSPFNSEKLNSKDLYIVGSVHGLVCLRKSNSVFRTIIWNPLIKRYLKIPAEADTKFTKNTCCTYAVTGFGFDSLRNDYKVVKIVFVVRRDIFCLRVGVYSLQEHKWRMLDPNELRFRIVNPYFVMTSCFTNGSIHWIVSEEIEDGHQLREHGNFILSFDMNREHFNRIDLPNDLVKASLNDLQISETNGLLSVFHYKKKEANGYYHGFKVCDIWLKDECGTKKLWTKICDINIEDGFVKRVLGLRKNGEILIVKKKIGEDLASYDPKSGRINAFGSLRDSYIFYGGASNESLLLLDKIKCSYMEPKMEFAG